VSKKTKSKDFPYSIRSIGPGADPGVQAVSPQVTISHPPGGRLPLLSARPVVTSPATEHHRHLAGTKLYYLVIEAHRCQQLAQGCYAALPRVGFEPVNYWSHVQRYTLVSRWIKIITITTTAVLWPFVWDYTGEPVPEETSSSGFYGTREDNRGRRTDNPAGLQLHPD